MAGLSGDDLLSTSEVARLLGLASDYVRRLARTEKLKPAKQTETGYRFFKRSDVEAFARSHAQAQPRYGRRRRDLSLDEKEPPKR